MDLPQISISYHICFGFLLLKKNCNSLFVGVSNYSTPYSMLLIINTYNEFLKVIQGAEKLLVLSPDENSCTRKIYLINDKELIFISVFILCQR